jgi:hypothetical protein
MNTEMNIQDVIDTETGRTVRYTIEIDQGDTHREAEIVIKNNTAYITSILGKETKELEITDDVIFGDAHMIKRVNEALRDKPVKEAVYTILSPMDGKLERVRVKYLGTELVVLNEKTYDTWAFEYQSEETGVKTKYWIDAETEGMLQFQVRNRLVFKADRSVVDRIKLADMDASLITKTNQKIGDIHSISYMKVKAHIEPTGIKVTSDNLNVPGQKFEGTVTSNKIEGIFEIEHKRYNGTDAPPFPYNYSDEMSVYLSNKDYNETDDPVLVAKAEEITSGSQDSWDAACRLSKWVAENISYAIPGGGTPRNTYDMRAGECGAHSMLLSTFCRAVGIPARVVWGGMYIPNFGGAFGQHAWTEIYMGSAGWIPVDATAFENDFLDSGHIRIGEYTSISTSFNGKEIEILDHRLTTSSDEDLNVSEKYSKYLGTYTQGPRNLIVKIENSGLVIDIPGKAVLPLNDPDESGYWFCKIAPQIYIEFNTNDKGKVDDMIFHQIMSVQRKTSSMKNTVDTPENLEAFVGDYYLPGSNHNFNVFCKEDTLYFQNPIENRTTVIFPSQDSNNIWKDDNFRTYYFDLNEEGIAASLKIDITDKLYKE